MEYYNHLDTIYIQVDSVKKENIWVTKNKNGLRNSIAHQGIMPDVKDMRKISKQEFQLAASQVQQEINKLIGL